MQHEAAGQTAATIPWSKYTHVIHSALRPTYSNEVCGLDTTEGLLRAANIEDFVNGAHAAGVKAIIGIRQDDTLEAITACTAPQNIEQFVDRIRTFVTNTGYDGLDLDWENNTITPQYQDLIRRLRTALPTAILSVVVGFAQRFMTGAVQYDLDQINIRAYDLDSQDLTGSPINYTWYHSPTLQGANTQDQSMDVLSWYYVSAGNASSKLGLAVPFYGRIRNACLNETGTNGVTDPNQAWVGRAEIGSIPYRDLVNSTYWSLGAHVWDDSRSSQYIQYRNGSCATDAFIPYVGPDQLQAVAALIKGNRLGGIATYGLPYEYMAQQIGDARYPLSTALYDAMIESYNEPVTITTTRTTTAPTATSPPAPTRISRMRPQPTSMSAGAPSSVASTSPGVRTTGGTFTYHVDSVNGLDSNPGTLANPWKTIAKVNSTTLLPGQSVGFKSGGTWREQLTPRQSGTAGYPITFGAYGSGAQPIIKGSDLVTGWTNNAGSATSVGDTPTSTRAVGTTVEIWNRVTTGASALPLQSYSAYFGGGWKNATLLKFALYTDSSNHVGTLIANTTSAQISLVQNSWNAAPVPSGPTLSASTPYWICMQSNGGADSFPGKTSGGTQSAYLYSFTFGTFPSIPSGLAYNNSGSSVYMDIGSTGVLNTWYATVTRQPYTVWFNGTLGTEEATVAAVGAANEWYWASNLLYVYSTTNPGTAYTSPGVEASDRQTVALYNVNYVTLNGLTFAQGGNLNSGANSVHIHESQNIVLSNCSVLDSVNIGVGIEDVVGSGTFLFDSCIFRGTGEHPDTTGGAPSGMQTYNLSSTNTTTVQNCTFQDMDAWGYHHGHGIYHQSGQLIWRNNFHYGDRGTTEAGAGAGAAVRLASPAGATVYNNIFSNQGGRRYWGILIDQNGTNQIYNNDFYENNYAIVTESIGGPSTNSIENNIVCCTSTNEWWFVDDTGALYAGDHNVFYGPGTVYWTWNGGANISSLAGWKSASSRDAHSINANPLLNNASTGDFTLQAGSPAIGSGVYIPGVSTTNPPNIGAK
jgi:GH18 family chitinase